jgi:Cu(I)/Ag(I) efflux system membrane fusion protein
MKTKTIFSIFTIITILSSSFTACTGKKSDGTEQTSEHAKEIYTCPMHPSVISDRPGACPVCGMALVKKTAQQDASAEDLSLLQSVSLSPTQRVIANVATEIVRMQTISRKVTAVGVVDFAEPNLAIVPARFSGRLEKLHVNYTGEVVKKGQTLFELYSPDLITAQNELLLAIKSKQEPLIQASRDRLQFHFGLSELQINEIETNQKVLYSIPFNSPISGTVISKEIQEGQYVDEGTTLYKLADLSRVWVNLDVYEKDIQSVKIGSSVQITTESYANERIDGKVTFVEPVVNSDTRTVRVRAEFCNPAGRLKPQMYVTAQIVTQSKYTMVVPASAVISTGKRNVVWVEVKKNTFEPRDVVVGIQTDDRVEILSGLKIGEAVVRTGGYLIDSESQLQQPAATGGHQHGVSTENNTSTYDDTHLSDEVTIIVDGGYSPSEIYARKGQKLVIHFERHDDIKCTDEVVFPDFNIKKYLTPHKTTTIEITPKKAGEFRFHCGMDMLEGKIVVK